ncbi:hypothetical protein FRC07_003429 [Ceratobasidium sp. 392]|nr:hypothetical protein FRC07_003429 [Ceratobasidium sp. 392]
MPFSASSHSASDASFTRRVKPLPKRRRTSHTGSDLDGTDSYTSPSYYHPIHSGRVVRLKQESNITPYPNSTAKSLSFQARSRVMDDADGEGDYTDHLQQPNNTKKRKVPAVTTIGATRNTSAMPDDDDKFDDDAADRSRVDLSRETAGGVSAGMTGDVPGSNPSSVIITHRKKCSPVTLATIRLKELLEARRKMMAAVIQDGTDPLALDFALSAPFAPSLATQSARTWPRSFTFSCVNPTSTKYALAKQTAAGLQLRFQTELARQATSATEVIPKIPSKHPNDPTTGQRKKMESNPTQASSKVPHSDTTRPPTKSNKTKKKKRSALANASNPHHLRNYVPSRVPQSNIHPSSSSVHGQSSGAFLGLLALKFLSATLPPRRKGRLSGVDSLGPSLVRPESEWICPFCEYSLFYGDDAAMHRAVKNRRKILRRRRKARERAAAAASGTAVSASQDVSEDEESGEDDDSFDDVGDVAPVSIPPQTGRTGARQNNPGPHPGG